MGKKGRTPTALSTRGLGQHAGNLKINGGVSQMAFPEFSTRHFQEINTKENAIVICLVYPFLVLSVRYSACREKIRVKL